MVPGEIPGRGSRESSLHETPAAGPLTGSLGRSRALSLRPGPAASLAPLLPVV